MLIEDTNQALVIDKLVERWTAERVAGELYDLALARTRATGELGQLAERFQTIRQKEREHEELVERLLRRFGRDPYLEPSPAAELARRELHPLVEVARHPSATFAHVLGAILHLELVEETGWELLEELGKQAGIDDDALRAFRAAARAESEHVHFVRTRLAQLEREELTLPGHHPSV